MSWQTKDLGNTLTSIKTGSTPPTSHPEYFDGSISWFTPSDIGETKFLLKSSRTISDLGLSKGKAKLFPKNSLLVTCIGNIGRVGILSQPASSNQQITSLTFKSEIDANFAYYWFLLKQKDIERLANQAVVPILNNERLQAIEFSYPLLTEQKRIAAVLDKADRLRRQRRFAQTLSDSFLQSVFIKLFGDPIKNTQGFKQVPLDDIGEVKGGLQLSSVRDNLPLKRPYLRVANVFRNELNLSEIKFIGLTEVEFESVRLRKGDILIVEGHGNVDEIGRCAIWNGSIQDCVHQNHLIRVRANSEHISEIYLARYINFSGRKYFTKSSNTTSGLNTISTGIVKRCPVLLPPLSLQKKFASIVQKFERVRRRQREATRQAEHLFQTLLHRAFRDEL